MSRKDRELSLHSFVATDDQESLLGHGESYQGTNQNKWRPILFVATAVIVVASFTVLVALILAGVIPVPDTGSHQRVGRFFQISDVHLDPLYSVTGNLSTHCRAVAIPGYTLELPPELTSLKPSPFGQYGCDPPELLVNATLDAMRAVDNDPDFLLLTGDLVAHALPSMLIANAAIARVTALIMEKFPNAAVVPVIGNNDVYPDYHLPYGPTLWLDSLANMWSPWLGVEQQKTFRMGGFYSVDIKSKRAKDPSENSLRILVLNTVLYSPRHVAGNATEITETTFSQAMPQSLESQPKDPNGQFDWMARELTDARNTKKRVIIVGHIPFGLNDFDATFGWVSNYTDTYLGLLKQFSDVIENQIFAHYHTDDFRIQWEDTSNHLTRGGDRKAISSMIIHPSISPNHFTNPGFRYYQYNLGQKSPLIADYTHYYADLFLANHFNKTTWTSEYSFSDAYQVNGANTEAFQTIVSSFADTSSNLLRYVAYKQVDFVKDRSRVVCAMDSNHQSDYEGCLASQTDVGKLRDLVLRSRPWWLS